MGIDLGTTNSCVAMVRDGQARVLKDTKGIAVHPSVISFHPDGRVLVGREAAERKVIDAANTFFSVKRLIGRDYSDPDVQRLGEDFPFSIVQGQKGQVLTHARGREFTLPEVSSIVLRYLRQVASLAVGTEVCEAVITVPANFNDVQRSSTKLAGRIAGLDVLRILNEPTAAALAYGYGQGLNERVAVYDFGGGTFDVTILDLRDNVFEVISTAGDMFLGGDDFDHRLIDQMIMSFLELHHVDLRDNPIALQRLRGVSEQIKRQLSQRSQVSARVRELDYGPGGAPLDMNFSITREAFEARIADLVERSLQVCDEALRLAQLSASQLDSVILVGGTTRIPLVRQSVEGYFGRPPRLDLNPDEVVAIGAAIQAYALGGRKPKLSSVPPPAQLPENLGRPLTAQAGASGASAQVPLAAAVLGGELPDDLPSPRGGPRSDRQSSSVESAQDLPLPMGASPPMPGALLGGGLPEDLPSRRNSPAPGHSRPGLGAASPPPPIQGGVPAGGAGFSGPLPDNLPSRRLPAAKPGASPAAPPMAPLLPSLDQPLPLASPAASGAADWRPEFTAAGAEPATYEEQVKAPALIGQMPDPEGAAGVPPSASFGGGPQPDLSFGGGPPADLPLDADEEGGAHDWDVVSVPGQSIPQAENDDYVETAIPVAAPAPAAMPAGAGVQAPGVAPLPDHLLQEMGVSHVLIDVTPRSLAVQTAGGYCDVIIERNSPIPIEQSRIFSTSRDDQNMVVIRICQGESRRIEENTVLGEIALSGIRTAPRGEVRVSVCFEIDTDGIVSVSARDVDTGQEAATKVTVFGGMSEEEMRDLLQRYGQ
jgi:molecular chaperone DnaK